MSEGMLAANPTIEYCTVHPTVETTLHWNKCGRPMCVKCSVRTPVGYRCRECVKGQQATFYNATAFDPIIQSVVSVIMSAIAAEIIGYMGGMLGFLGFFITFAAGGAVGAFIADMACRAAGRRRGQYTWLIIAGGVALGAIFALPVVFATSRNWIGWGIYIFTATSAAAGQLRFRSR
jgi:hypothetical protein